MPYVLYLNTMTEIKRNGTELANIKGLTSVQVEEQREQYGKNTSLESGHSIWDNILEVVREPMFILLLVACGIYFISREFAEAFTMLAALIFVAGIDIFQSFRSQKAVKALTKITSKKAKVIRNSQTIEIDIENIVKGDIIIIEEGIIIPADARIISSNDFALNEAILTGESVSVEKFSGDAIFQGTLVVRGYAFATVEAIGESTTLSGIGHLVASTGKEKTPLQEKVTAFVKVMVVAGSLAFLFVWFYYWWESKDFLHGLLHGLTMAMSVLPEEIPVALSTFMAIGTYRLLRRGIIARSPQAVETLGSATVICVDKTGTLTKNLMKVQLTYSIMDKKETNYSDDPSYNEVLEYAMWSSEEEPFDPMEISIHRQYGLLTDRDLRDEYKMIHEFPLAGEPPVMTHMFINRDGQHKVGCKGGLEGVLKLCDISESDKTAILEKSKDYAQEGLRVLGVAKGEWEEDTYPEIQEEIDFSFLGIIAFYDPPEAHMEEVVQQFQQAGLKVKMITGDYPETAGAIASQIGLSNEKIILGDDIAGLQSSALHEVVRQSDVFARVSPHQKLKIIEALKSTGEVVAMTGDGVNDAPALKSAHIGIAMGKRGTEVAKGASDLVLSNDNLAQMIDAVYIGRRINKNLTKAIRYIISIHIPIILLVTMPIFMTWLPEMLFTPVHVIFLELIMGPTCSIIYENEPIPRGDLKYPAKKNQKNLLTSPQLLVTIIQGLMITVGCLLAGYYAYTQGSNGDEIRTLVFSSLIFANIFLTLINRSFSKPIWKTITRKNWMIPVIVMLSMVILFFILYLPGLNNIFRVKALPVSSLLIPGLLAFLFTVWLDGLKIWKSG